MRQRHDFYTLCPGCETRIELTLAENLQASRAGTSCRCRACNHEWVCIQEWINRRESLERSQAILPPLQSTPAAQDRRPMPTRPAPTPAAMQPPRPHLPTFQPQRPDQSAPAMEPLTGHSSVSDSNASEPTAPGHGVGPGVPNHAFGTDNSHTAAAGTDHPLDGNGPAEPPPAAPAVPAPHAWSFERHQQRQPLPRSGHLPATGR